MFVLWRTLTVLDLLCSELWCFTAGEKGIGKSTGKALHYKGSIFHRIIKGFMAQVCDLFLYQLLRVLLKFLELEGERKGNKKIRMLFLWVSSLCNRQTLTWWSIFYCRVVIFQIKMVNYTVPNYSIFLLSHYTRLFVCLFVFYSWLVFRGKSLFVCMQALVEKVFMEENLQVGSPFFFFFWKLRNIGLFGKAIFVLELLG